MRHSRASSSASVLRGLRVAKAFSLAYDMSCPTSRVCACAAASSSTFLTGAAPRRTPPAAPLANVPRVNGRRRAGDVRASAGAFAVGGGSYGGGGLDTLYTIAMAIGTAYIGWELLAAKSSGPDEEDACPNCGCAPLPHLTPPSPFTYVRCLSARNPSAPTPCPAKGRGYGRRGARAGGSRCEHMTLFAFIVSHHSGFLRLVGRGISTRYVSRFGGCPETRPAGR